MLPERLADAGHVPGTGACRDGEPPADGRRWHAVYVKSRHEFVARDDLARADVTTFLPAVQRLRQWKDRKKLVDFPIFPGYLFVRLQPSLEAFLRVCKTRGVVKFLAAERGNPTPVPDREIESLRVLLEKGGEFDIYPHLKAGAAVRVRRGLFQGAEGVLAVKGNKHKFVVNISILGRCVGVGIHADDVEAA